MMVPPHSQRNMGDLRHPLPQPLPTLAVLAGGLGSRMGMDKALLNIGGVSILKHILGSINWKGPTLLIRGAGQVLPEGANQFTRCAFDTISGEGPLRGILTAIRNAPGMVVVATVDMPGITAEILQTLLASLESCAHLKGVMYTRQLESTRQVEPFPSAFRQSAGETIEADLERGQRSIRKLLDYPDFGTLEADPFVPASIWANINTPQDLALVTKPVRAEYDGTP